MRVAPYTGAMTTSPLRIGTCTRCAATQSLETDRTMVPCVTDGCPRLVRVAVVAQRVGRRECGPHCTEGTGKSCTCTCGGQAHGQAYRIRP